MTTTRAYSEGSFEKARTVVTSTWDVMFNPSTMIRKMQMTAAKQNGPKSKGLQWVWNLYYLHDYINGIDIEHLNFLELSRNTLVKLRGATGWRTADLLGLFTEKVTFPADASGAYISLWNLKTSKGAWSSPTFIPRLAPAFKDLCTVAAIELLIARQAKQMGGIAPTYIEPANAVFTPLFVYLVKNKPAKPCSVDTLRKYFIAYFLDNTQDALDHNKVLGASYKPHSCRNAVASLLQKLGVPSAEIAAHMCTSAASLEATYIRPISDPSVIPDECVKQFTNPALKLLVPFVHFKTFVSGNGCQCSYLVASKSSMGGARRSEALDKLLRGDEPEGRGDEAEAL